MCNLSSLACQQFKSNFINRLCSISLITISLLKFGWKNCTLLHLFNCLRFYSFRDKITAFSSSSPFFRARLIDLLSSAERLTEVPIPTRFIFFSLGPPGKYRQCKQVGRSIATLMTDEVRKDRMLPYVLHKRLCSVTLLLVENT